MYESFLFGHKNTSTILLQPVMEEELIWIPKEAELIAKNCGMDDFAILAVKVNDWNYDLSPWEAPALFGSEPFGGGGRVLLEHIGKLIRSEYKGKRICIGGYSLAGLFSLWAASECDWFDGVAAASPSVWFPGFTEYIRKNSAKIRKVYLSLGDTESKTKNKILATTDDCIRNDYEIYRTAGLLIKLEWNPGGHFVDPDIRTAKAFAWLMRD